MHELVLRATAPENDISVAPNAMVVVAHPDDETIALGARLSRFKTARFIHVTDGAPRNQFDSSSHGFRNLDEYREARRRELHRALGLAEIPNDRLLCFGIPDQEVGFHLDEITRSLACLVEHWQPEVIVSHPYEGGHPDHDACAFAVHRAAAIAAIERERSVLIVEGAFYHLAANGIRTESFLPSAQEVEQVAYCLNPEEQRRKRDLLACFATQRETLKLFPLVTERFRTAPQYDFSSPPQQPTLYDQRDWGMTSARFCGLVREAEQSLQSKGVR
jgi:N-acetylglucosamine malate deacetylase 2